MVCSTRDEMLEPTTAAVDDAEEGHDTITVEIMNKATTPEDMSAASG